VRQFKSQWDFWNFSNAVRGKLRYIRAPEHDAFLKAVLATSATRKVQLNSGQIFWRAQLGNDSRDWEQDGETYQVPYAHPAARMKPLRGQASEGRANAKGIPCLYLANRKETAMSEVRPWVGSYASVGQFKLLKEIEIIDCARNHDKTLPYYFDEPTPKKRAEVVWSLIDVAFAQPITRNDDTGDYAATQIIAELFKSTGFGGVAYKSNFEKEGLNLALFDIDVADLVNCHLYRVKSVKMEFSQEHDGSYFVKKHYHKD
jgi:RES domain